MLAQLVVREYAAQKVLAFVIVVGLLAVGYVVFLYWTEWERSCCGKTPRFCRCPSTWLGAMTPPRSDDDE